MKELILERHCYVVPRLRKQHHPIADQRFKLIWYPEMGMSQFRRIMYQPYVQSIVTECPWLIGCYDEMNVSIWDTELDDFQMTPVQTYGIEPDSVIGHLIGIRQSIPSTPLDGGEAMRKTIKRYEDSYKRAILKEKSK